MADHSERMLAMTDLDEFDREQDRLSDAWMRATTWPRQYVSLKNRLHRIHLARLARSKGAAVVLLVRPESCRASGRSWLWPEYGLIAHSCRSALPG